MGRFHRNRSHSGRPSTLSCSPWQKGHWHSGTLGDLAESGNAASYQHVPCLQPLVAHAKLSWKPSRTRSGGWRVVLEWWSRLLEALGLPKGPCALHVFLMYLHIVISVWTKRALVMLYLVWRCLLLRRLVASLLLMMTKTSKMSFFSVPPPRCPIPEMHENVWLWNAEDELLHRHQVLQRWPVQHLWWISMMAPRGRRALKSSRSSTTHVGSRWMKVHFQWRQTCIVKNWTNKTIEKRSLWCLWMHCDCLGMVLVKFRNPWVWFGLIC